MTIKPGEWATAQDILDDLGTRLSRAANLKDLVNPTEAQVNLGLRGMARQSPESVEITGGAIAGVNLGTEVLPIGYAAIANLNVTAEMTSPPTGFFWQNQGATVVRLNDRLLVGGAAANDASKPNETKDWLSEIIGWPVYNGTAAITSAFGTIGLTVGSQTADLDPIAASSTETSIGIAAFGIANNLGTFPSGYFAAYAIYGEARVYPGTVSNAFGAEINAVNMSGSANVTPTPYRELATGSVQALRLASGGGQGLFPDPAISALSIVPNESTFNVGIVFDKEALTGADGTDGFATAIAMAKGHLLTWFTEGDGDGAATMTITSAVTNPAKYVSMQAHDGGWLFIQPSGHVGFTVSTVEGAETGIGVKPAAAGGDAEIDVYGPGDNLNLRLAPKGTGTVLLAVPSISGAAAGDGSALPATPAAYLVVGDAAGTRLAVPAFNLPT
jgi:hypothetical protein